ncbi:RibD family protein [Loktanella sp. M215]|uniref:RibD family protein n=1 Tax=Loktanella sp. M215 TaxID=2675431 RepID=UPI001F245D1E|nr:RibD family protein [Loktanella sp. M215]MCF7698958.1 deaminase [Loktanella sp. M215]
MKITTFSELTIDGKLTLTRGGSSKALFRFYGAEMGQWFHAQRAAHDAIMVGAGTVRADDPELTVRHVTGRSPLRVIPTNDGNIPAHSHILTDGQPTLFAVPQALPDAARARLRHHDGISFIDCGADRVDLRLLAHGLAERGIASLMVEGGSQILHGLFAQHLVDRIVIKHIPVIAGATDAPTYLEGRPMDLSRWRIVECCVIGGVAVTIYDRQEDEA